METTTSDVSFCVLGKYGRSRGGRESRMGLSCRYNVIRLHFAIILQPLRTLLGNVLPKRNDLLL